ncbi:Nucleolar protein 16 [Penicillium brasilianum]|uniref:Nucleolar protein 16 n=1 Tax=Penicillium brasilianum TaxID=104259 RepID=A0A0F7TIK8_PENBI|nr:Nucleolar protein 16 [Penicillium brasilianum]CEJ56558.1 Putative Nucleolar protein 16 [Penicillium brasilianum]
MGKILQKRKARSGLSKAKAKNNRLKSGNKKINVLGNAIIAQNWDRELTLTQNYKKLGLLHKLNAPTGGKERIPGRNDLGEKSNSLHINGSAVAAAQIDLGETKVERDPETGKILRVIHDYDEIEVAGKKRRRDNPLNDPLNELSDNEDTPGRVISGSKVVQQLERQADLEGQGEKAKKPRHQSSREGEWISRLIEKHGDNISAMVRDRKLNPMQQTEGDIRRRLNKWKKGQA